MFGKEKKKKYNEVLVDKEFINREATVSLSFRLVSIQTADELRPEIPAGQPYLLMRGPLPEPGFVYVMLPRSAVDRFKALPPLAELTLRLTIRAASTRYLPTPVAELVAVVDSLGR